MSNPNQETVVITPQELPLHCSGPRHDTWNGHPRVFLPLPPHGSIECPYCGTIYRLDGEIGHHHF